MNLVIPRDGELTSQMWSAIGIVEYIFRNSHAKTVGKACMSLQLVDIQRYLRLARVELTGQNTGLREQFKPHETLQGNNLNPDC
jgi:hypothetical protein